MKSILSIIVYEIYGLCDFFLTIFSFFMIV